VRCGECLKRGRARKQVHFARRAEAAELRRLVEEREKESAARLAAANAEQRQEREDAEAKADAEALREEMRRNDEQRREAEAEEARLQAEARQAKGTPLGVTIAWARRLQCVRGV